MDIKTSFANEIEDSEFSEGDSALVLVRHLDGHEAIYSLGKEGCKEDHFECQVKVSSVPASLLFARVTFASICRWEFVSAEEISDIKDRWEIAHYPYLPKTSET